MKSRAKLLDPLRDNLFRRVVDEATGLTIMEKSCPKCSKKAGGIIYYPETAFMACLDSKNRKGTDRDCQKHRKQPRPVLLDPTAPAVAES